MPHILEHIFIVGFRDWVTRPMIDSLNQAKHVYIWEFMYPSYFLVPSQPIGGTILDLCNDYYSSGMCLFAHPDIVHYLDLTFKGDLNDDHEADLEDLMILINYIFFGLQVHDATLCYGDVNCTLDVNMVDIIYFVNYLFRGGPPPIGSPL